MTIIASLILGIVQGLTEFLPVSSSGHLMLLNTLFNINGDFLLLGIILHLATLLAVVIVFYKEIWWLIKNPFSKEMKKLVIATIPTVIIVFIFKLFIESAYENVSILPFTFMLTAFILICTQLLSGKNKFEEKRDIKTFSAFMMGVSQGFAVIPGISRSGSTICTGLVLGENREESAKFSFLMSIPIILASLFYELIFSESSSILEIGIVPLIVSFLSAFIVGIFSIKFMFKVIKKSKYYYFAFYLIALSIISFFVV